MWFKREKKPATGTDSSRARGQAIEALAEHFLRQHGLRSITRNYTIKAGEIDLIMRDGDVLVFIEVRYRASSQHGSGAESITAAKQQRLLKTASHYLQKHYPHKEPDCRFDVISASGTPAEFNWIRNAFGD